MTITKEKIENKLIVAVEGRLDTVTSPDLDQELKGELDGIEELVLDFSQLQYISSAGLRVLLSTQKVMSKQGSMVLTGVNQTVMEVFDVTGFSDILTIREATEAEEAK